MTLDRKDFAPLIPHRGAMCLLDRVLHWDEGGLVATSDSHRCPHNPLRRGGALSAVHAFEYAAQAMAVHGGLRSARGGDRLPGGFLAAVRNVHLHVPRLDTLAGRLRIEVAEQYAQAGNMIYRFQVRSDQGAVADGTAVVVAHAVGTDA